MTTSYWFFFSIEFCTNRIFSVVFFLLLLLNVSVSWMMNGIIHKYEYKVNCMVIKLRSKKKKKKKRHREREVLHYLHMIRTMKSIWQASLFSLSFLFKCRLHRDGVFSIHSTHLFFPLSLSLSPSFAFIWPSR